MMGSIGSSFSLLRSTVIHATANFINSSIADQATKMSVWLTRRPATHCSMGITSPTATIPAKNARAISLRGSGCLESSRSQNHSHKKVGNTPPPAAMRKGKASSTSELLHSWPFCDHQQSTLFLRQLLPYRFGDEGHEGVEEF